MKLKLISFLSVFIALNCYAANRPIPANIGGVGVSNPASITIDAPVVFSGAFSTTIAVTAASVVTLPTGVHTLASNDGSNATGTWPIIASGNTITGTGNQVYANGLAGIPQTGAVTLSLPQDLSPTDNPTFITETLTGVVKDALVFTNASKTLTAIDQPNVIDFTPTIGDGTNNFTTSGSTSGAFWKLGNLYIVNARIVWTSKGAAAGGTTVKISIPHTSASTSATGVTLAYISGINPTGSYITSAVVSGAAYAALYGVSAAGMVTPVTVSQCNATGEIDYTLIFWQQPD